MAASIEPEKKEDDQVSLEDRLLQLTEENEVLRQDNQDLHGQNQKYLAMVQGMPDPARLLRLHRVEPHRCQDDCTNPASSSPNGSSSSDMGMSGNGSINDTSFGKTLGENTEDQSRAIIILKMKDQQQTIADLQNRVMMLVEEKLSLQTVIEDLQHEREIRPPSIDIDNSSSNGASSPWTFKSLLRTPDTLTKKEGVDVEFFASPLPIMVSSKDDPEDRPLSAGQQQSHLLVKSLEKRRSIDGSSMTGEQSLKHFGRRLSNMFGAGPSEDGTSVSCTGEVNLQQGRASPSTFSSCADTHRNSPTPIDSDDDLKLSHHRGDNGGKDQSQGRKEKRRSSTNGGVSNSRETWNQSRGDVLDLPVIGMDDPSVVSSSHQGQFLTSAMERKRHTTTWLGGN